MGDFNEKKTEFNAAIASLMRLHSLLQDCNEYRRLCFQEGYNLNALKLWKYTIEAMYSEMYGKIKGSKYYDKIEKLFSYYKKVGRVLELSTMEEGSTTINIKSFHKLYRLNDKIEKSLRLIADRKGMLIPDEEDMFGR